MKNFFLFLCFYSVICYEAVGGKHDAAAEASSASSSGACQASFTDTEDDDFLYRHTREQLTEIAKNPHHERQWDALSFLWGGASEKDRNQFKAPLMAIAKSVNHVRQVDAIKYLWSSGPMSERKNRLDIRETARAIAKDPHHERQWDVIEIIWNLWGMDNPLSDYGGPEDRADLQESLLNIARDFSHDNQWRAIILLQSDFLVRGDDSSFQDLKQLIIRIATDPNHDKQLEAISNLWHYHKPQEEIENRAMLRAPLMAIATDANHKRRWEAIINLWWNSTAETLDEDRKILREFLISIAQNPNDRIQKNALNHLWYYKVEDRPEIYDSLVDYVISSFECRLDLYYINIINQSSNLGLENSQDMYIQAELSLVDLFNDRDADFLRTILDKYDSELKNLVAEEAYLVRAIQFFSEEDDFEALSLANLMLQGVVLEHTRLLKRSMMKKFRNEVNEVIRKISELI